MTNRKLEQEDYRRSYRIVGVLQNPWFKPGTHPHLIDFYRTNYEFRRRVLARSRTGKVLREVFGDEVFREIYWTDASFESGEVSNHKSQPDLDFLEREIAGAVIVVAFGRVAQIAMRMLTLGGRAKQTHNFKYVEALHPTSRNHQAFLDSLQDVRAVLASDKRDS